MYMVEDRYNKENAPIKHLYNEQILEDMLKKINLLKRNGFDDDESINKDVKECLNDSFISLAIYISEVKKERKKI